MTGDFKITYSDLTTFEGNLFTKTWIKAPIQPIDEILFQFDTTNIKMQGFREYNLTYESIAIVGKGTTRITNITFAGRDKEKSVLYIFDFKTKHIVKKITAIGKEYGNLESNTWKAGNTRSMAQDYML